MNLQPDPLDPIGPSKRLEGHRNLASAAKAGFKPLYEKIPSFAVGPTPQDNRRRFERVFKPWPKWVFRLIAEVWHVDLPTIPKEVIFQSFRVLNVVFFRCPIDPARAAANIRFDVINSIGPARMQLIMAAMIGHSFEHLQSARGKLGASKEKGEISEAEYAKMSKILSEESWELLMKETVNTWSKDKDQK